MRGVAHDVHALAAAAERRLHEQREPDALGLALRAAQVDRLGGAGHDRHAAASAARRAAALSPMVSIACADGPTNVRPASVTASANCARSDRNPYPGWTKRGLRAARGVQDRLDRQVGLRGRRRADAERLVGHLHVQRVAVGVGVDGDAGDAQLAAGADDAHRDLAAVGDQDLVVSAGLSSLARDTLRLREGVKRAMAAVDLERALRSPVSSAPVRWDEVTGSTNATALRAGATQGRRSGPWWGRATDRGPGPARPHLDGPTRRRAHVSVVLRPRARALGRAGC